MLLSLRKKGLTSLFKEVRVFKVSPHLLSPHLDFPDFSCPRKELQNRKKEPRWNRQPALSEQNFREWNKEPDPSDMFRERKMRTKFFCTNFLNTARGPGHPGKIPGTSRIPLFETQGRQSFEGGHEVFGHHPFAWKTPTPPGGLRTQKLNLCALFSCLNVSEPYLSQEKASAEI